MLHQSIIKTIKEHPKVAEITSFFLLAFLVVVWGLNWSVMKLALQAMPPLWLGETRLLTATLFIFAFFFALGKIKIPTRADMPIILSIGLLQMGLFTALSSLGLLHVEAGRSTILVYTTPLWVTPLAVFFFKEPLPLAKMIGLLLGIAGILVLFNPFHFNWRDHNVVLGNGLLLLAAIAWAVCILHIRFARWHLSPAQLLPWQLLVSSIMLFLFAIFLEPKPTIHWSWHLAGLLVYIGPFASAFGYWAVIEVSRKLPAVTTSLCLLAIPIAGLFGAKLLLNENIGFQNSISVILIIAGLLFIIRAGKSKK